MRDIMRFIAQAFTGGFFSHYNEHDYDTDVRKLQSVCDGFDTEAVLIGWNVNAPYENFILKLRERNIKAYLWLPVFSEYGEDAACAVDYMGEKHKRAVSDADDDFTFACPGNQTNIELAAGYYDKYFSGHGFDGIFLDKIRYSSFGNGFRSAMGCFCDCCCAHYEAEGVDIEEVKAILGMPDKGFLVPDGLTGLRYTFENSLIDGFYRSRANLITSSVRKTADMFINKGLAIGLDVYAPPFAYLVGQDIEAMSAFSDYIKPMIYRVTDAPAGIPYETRHLVNEMHKNGCGIGGRLEALWEAESLADAVCFDKQLRLLKEVSCDIYSGLEINKADFCATDKQYVNETLQAIEASGIAGCVLSWNVLAETVNSSVFNRTTCFSY